MSVAAKPSTVRVDQFFTVQKRDSTAGARYSKQRVTGKEPQANGVPEKEKYEAVVSASFAELRQWEDFFAYPGQHTTENAQRTYRLELT